MPLEMYVVHFVTSTHSSQPQVQGASIKYEVGNSVDVRTIAMNATGLQNIIDNNVSSHPIDTQVTLYYYIRKK